MWKLNSLDVWGGEEEGDFDINDFFHLADIDEGDFDTKDGLIALLIEKEYLVEGVEERVEVLWDSESFIEVRKKANGYPLFHLNKRY